MNTDSSERTILITGATGCLGRALALEASKTNATLILHGRTTKSLEAIDDEIQAIRETKTILWPLDFVQASDDVITQTIADLTQVISCIDIIFNCATKLGQQTPILQEEHSAWRDVIQVNCEAPRLLLKHCLPLLIEARKAQSIFFETDEQEYKLYEGSFGFGKSMIRHLCTQINQEFENVNHVRAVIIKIEPLFSALRAKTFPGEDPKLNASAANEAKRIFSLLE